ncbi:hypothetical protein HDV00_011599 [Rhizophlyctis rosea]|nr:hypothetical protein HDV00_011599 [Rhizophlyctis rosea]
MQPYERVPLNEESQPETEVLFQARPSLDDSGSSSAGASSSSEPSRTVPRPLPFPTRGSDGVFANLSAKPDAPTTPEKQFQEFEPPSYTDVVHENPPAYFEPTTIFAATVGEDGDILIEGLPVGNFWAFIANMFISMSFDFIGFLLTMLLATSHAARCGSRSGLGITLLRYGLYIQSSQYEKDVEEFNELYDPSNPETPEEIQAENLWISYLLMGAGIFMILKANIEFTRIRRMRDIVLTAPAGSNV